MNEVHLVGRAGKEPEIKYTDEGKAVATVSMAVSARGDNPAHWFNLTVWEKTAEILTKYVRKGHYFSVKGRIKQDKWQDRETGEERVGMTIVVETLTLCQSKSNGSEQSDYNDDAF